MSGDDPLRPRWSVVVPVYNSGPALAELVDRILATFDEHLEGDVEVLLVDDGSPRRDTADLVVELARRNRVKGVRLTRNYGKPGAVLCGLALSTGTWVVTIDDDGQQRPEDIPALAAHRAHDVVIATHENKHHTAAQRLTSAVKHQFDRHVLGYAFPLSPLKLLHRRVVDGMVEVAGNRPFVPALIREVTDDVVAVSLPHERSAYERSRYTLAGRWRQFLNLLIGNSSVFMHAVVVLGLLVMALSLLLVAAIVVRRFLGIPTAAGWSSLMIAILLVGGLNLGAMGVAGQYFIRILDTSSRKPAFRVREVHDGDDEVHRRSSSRSGDERPAD